MTEEIKVKLSLKETLEVLKGAAFVISKANAVMADGHIDFKDLKVALEVANDYQIILDAIEGFNVVDEELKDLDDAETLQVGLAVISLIKDIKNLLLLFKGNK